MTSFLDNNCIYLNKDKGNKAKLHRLANDAGQESTNSMRFDRF